MITLAEIFVGWRLDLYWSPSLCLFCLHRRGRHLHEGDCPRLLVQCGGSDPKPPAFCASLQQRGGATTTAEMIKGPHAEFWGNLVSLTKEGFAFTLFKIKSLAGGGGGSYQSM